MNEELQKTLASVLEKSMEVAEKTGQWALDMAPQLIEQYLLWEFWSSAFLLILCVILLIPAYYGAKYLMLAITYEENFKDLYQEDKGFFLLFWFLFSLIQIVFSCVHIYTMIFIKVAPEIYLIKNLL